MDRLIQQAIHQVLNPIFDRDFSESSYGFRPGRGAHQAILKAKEYVAEGKRGVAEDMARKTAGSHKGAWRNAMTKAMHIAFPVSFFEDMGLISLFQQKQKFSVVS